MKKNSRLKEARLKAGLSQQELAEKMGSTSSYVTMIENGKGFSIKKARQIAEILNSDAEWLYKGNREDTKSNTETEPIPNNISNHSEPNNEDEMILTKELFENLNDLIRSKNEKILQLEQRINELEGVKAKRSVS